jgi:hypothetical protein
MIPSNRFFPFFFVAILSFSLGVGKAHSASFPSFSASFLASVEMACSMQNQKEFVQRYNKTFEATKAQTIFVSNKYGSVDVKTWAQPQVLINIKVTVRANGQADADKTFKRVQIYFSEGADFIKGESVIENQSQGFWSNNTSDFSIDYEVFMPAGNKLNLMNKYGHSAIGMLTSDVVAEQSYGNIKVESANACALTIKYGDAHLGHIKALSGSVIYGNLQLEEAKNMVLTSKYSKLIIQNVHNAQFHSAYDDFEIKTAGNINIESRYGDFAINKVNVLNIESKYTDFKIKRLEQSGNLNSDHGDVKVEQIAQHFGTINISGDHSSYWLTIESGAAYQLDASGNNTLIKRPAAFHTTVSQVKGNANEVVGTCGGAKSHSIIRAKLKYGELIIR